MVFFNIWNLFVKFFKQKLIFQLILNFSLIQILIFKWLFYALSNLIFVPKILSSSCELFICKELLLRVRLDHVSYELVLQLIDIIVILVLVKEVIITLTLRELALHHSWFDGSEHQVDVL